MSQHDNETPHLPPPSVWPFAFAAGVACLLLGLVVSDVVAVIGAIIAVVFGVLWIRDLTKSVRTPAEPVEPERRVATTTVVEDEEEDHGHTRAVFLSGATLGLGAVIGGLVTVPALGFAVLPSFTNVEEPHPNLGPIDEYPENQWVITTFLEDEGIGEVTRRTMYIRNNGRHEETGEPSFTLIYSRCAHLGCPVQPNGPVFDDQKKELDNGVTLIPAQPVGFGCPCHGGQYDTEGNRTAGPPVRALDRAEFSIIDGNLVLGQFFSVSEVDGSGAEAVIHRYGRMPPGVHVDGVSAWLYPLEVPQ